MIDRSGAIALLSQQIWCWGQDVQRPEGNWLLEIGFQREKPPENRKECSSVYTLAINDRIRLVLRGFGVYLGDDRRGGLFIERFGFTPKYSIHPRLECPPWSDRDMPVFRCPTAQQRDEVAMMLLELIDWIRQYECDIVSHLGIDYRRDSLVKWNNGKRQTIPAEQMATSWRKLSLTIAADVNSWVPLDCDCESIC